MKNGKIICLIISFIYYLQFAKFPIERTVNETSFKLLSSYLVVDVTWFSKLVRFPDFSKKKATIRWFVRQSADTITVIRQYVVVGKWIVSTGLSILKSMWCTVHMTCIIISADCLSADCRNTQLDKFSIQTSLLSHVTELQTIEPNDRR
jgi:hypothetical protein